MMINATNVYDSGCGMESLHERLQQYLQRDPILLPDNARERVTAAWKRAAKLLAIEQCEGTALDPMVAWYAAYGINRALEGSRLEIGALRLLRFTDPYYGGVWELLGIACATDKPLGERAALIAEKGNVPFRVAAYWLSPERVRPLDATHRDKAIVTPRAQAGTDREHLRVFAGFERSYMPPNEWKAGHPPRIDFAAIVARMR